MPGRLRHASWALTLSVGLVIPRGGLAAPAPADATADAAPDAAGAPDDAAADADADDAAPAPAPRPTRADDAPQRDKAKRRSAFDLPVAKRTDPYGPRPRDVAELSHDQIVRFALDNPAVAAAQAEVEAMQAQLSKAKFLWVPQIDTLSTLSPGVNVKCDDVRLDDGTTDPFEFQYCRASDDPTLDVNTVKGYFSQLGRAGVRVSFRADTVIPLFTFGKIKNARKLAEVGVAITELKKVAVEHETLLRVEQAYAGLLAAREGQAILREAKRVVDRAYGRVEKDLGGDADDWDADPSEGNPDRDPDDLIKIELAALELEQQMREALKIEAVSLAALWALAGDAAPRGFDVRERRLLASKVEGGGGLESLEHYQKVAAVTRPEAKMAQAAIRARQAQQRLARSRFLPDFGIAVRVDLARSSAADQDMSQLYYQDGFNYSRVTAALAMTWRWDLGMVFDLRQAKAQVRAAEHTHEAARRLLGHEVAVAYADVVEASHLIGDAQTATELSWKLVISQEQRDSIGGGDAEKLLRALEKWYRMRFEQVEATHQHNEALARLGRAVGTPVGAAAAKGASTAAPKSDTDETKAAP